MSRLLIAAAPSSIVWIVIHPIAAVITFGLFWIAAQDPRDRTRRNRRGYRAPANEGVRLWP